MRSAPPNIALWLLGRSGVSEELIGDLTEEYGHRQSRTWLWRQVLVALALQPLQAIRFHRSRAIGAVLSGWFLFWLFGRFLFFPLASLDEWLFVRGLGDLRGWWPQGPFPFFAAACLGGLLNGWILGQFFRVPLIVAYAASVVLWNLAWFPFLLAQVITSGNPSQRSTLIIQSTIVLGVMPISIVMGGVLGRRADRVEGPQPPVATGPHS